MVYLAWSAFYWPINLSGGLHGLFLGLRHEICPCDLLYHTAGKTSVEEWGQDILAPSLFSWEQVDGFEADPGFSVSPGLEPRCWASRNGTSLALGDGVSNG